MGILDLLTGGSNSEDKGNISYLTQENASLRNKIKHQKYQLEAVKLTNNIIEKSSKLLNLSEIYTMLSQVEFGKIGISAFLFVTLEEGNFHPAANFGVSEEQTKAFCEEINNLSDIFQSLKEQLSMEELLINYQNLAAIIRSWHIIRAVIAPVIFENEFIGLCLLGTADTIIMTPETLINLSSALSSGIAIIHNYAKMHNESMLEKKELENRVLEHTKKLKDQVETVSQISREKNEFISTVSHELRTSLTSIHGFAKLLIEGRLGKLPEEAADRIKKILKQTEKLVKMVNTLLDINRIESRRVKMNLAMINLHDIVASVLDSFLGQLQQKHIKAVINIPKDLFFPADAIYMERVFSNLISNSIKFTPEHGEINISARPEKNIVHISVDDTGIGIAKEHIENIFKDFYHIDHPDLTDIRGIGLGLSLVKRIIEAHHGRIWVESELGKGTKFHLNLKLREN